MECSNCGHHNPAEANFCEQCGQSLTITCPVCSYVSPASAKFCSNCGNLLHGEVAPAAQEDTDLTRYLPTELLAKLRSARAGRAMQGERRTVTMLFADIKGSTAAAERMDPEDWAVVVNGAFEHLIAPVYRYEGTLAHLQGDAILAFFGAPIAHEDDPVRAIRAGLEITEEMRAYSDQVMAEWGIPIEIRVGINTGLVVVGEVGSDLRVEYTALGDAINVAARMEQTADPGTVRVTSKTIGLTGGLFEVEDLGGVEVKGKSEPVTAHRVIRFLAERVEEKRLPMVGRSDELDLLGGLCDRLVDGSGWIAAVIAEAGVGKSRLLQEIRNRADERRDISLVFDQPGDLAWMFGVSRSYDSANPFSTVRDMLRGWFGVDGSEGDFVRVTEAVDAIGVEDRDMPAYLGYLAGVPLSAPAEQFIGALETSALDAGASNALSAYLAELASQRPVVAVFEDLHWADDLSLALVESIMEVAEVEPFGLIVAMRPYREQASWRVHEVAQRDHHHRYTAVELDPLPQEESKILLEELLAGSAVDDETKEMVLQRSDGNPFFLEEMVRALDEAGVSEGERMTVPTSLTGILTARLDRLDEESRFIVQMASVLGSEFDRSLLVELLDGPATERRLLELLRKGILVEPVAAPQTLAFRHALIQEVAYETILRRTRKELHLRVAEHLIATSPDAVQDISRHLVEAGELEMAFPYLIEAGMRSARSMALADAIRQLGLAVDNSPLDADPALVEKAHAALGEAYALVPDLSRAAAAYQRLYEYGEEAKRPAARVAALNHLAYATATLGADLVTAQEYLEEARSLAEEIGDDLGMAQYHMNACFVASMGGQVDKAAEHDEATVVLGEKSGVDSIRLSGLVRRATNYASLLDLDKAEPAVAAALEAIEEVGAEEAHAIVTAFGSATLALARGDFREALDLATGSQSALERYASFYAAMNLRNIGALLHELGEVEGALSHMADSRRTAERMQQSFVKEAAASGMALIYATVGMPEPIDELRDETLAAFDGPLGEFMASTAWADLGFTNLMLDRVEDATADFDRGLQASSVTQYMDRPRLLGGRAIASIRLGDLEDARVRLDQATGFVSERRVATHDTLLRYVQGLLATAEGDVEEAERALIAAQTLAMDRGQRLRTAQVLMARQHLASRTGSEASSHAGAAIEVIEAIAGSIADEALADSFLQTWRARVGQAAPDAAG